MRQCIAVLTVFLAAACSGGLRSNAPAQQTYILRARAPQTPAAAQPALASLQIARPYPAPGLESEHIVIVQPDHRMGYLAASAWAEMCIRDSVKGPNFIALHELFDKVAESVEEHIDELAERITALGGTAYGLSLIHI